MPERPTVAEMSGSFRGPDSVEWLRAQRCVTHHAACDCIEFHTNAAMTHEQAEREQAAADAVRMAREVRSLHIRAIGIDRTRCMCGHQYPCVTRADADTVIERWTP